MSSLTIDLRKRLALRRALGVIDAHAEGAAMDAGFDAGEFSGPAHGRMERREIAAIGVALRVNDLDGAILVACNDDPDPLGTWHGRNE